MSRFLAEYIEAPEHLDILLLLQRTQDRAWTAEEVAQAVYTVASSARTRLERLVAGGLAVSDGADDPRFRYAPSSETLSRRVDMVREAYVKDRAGLIRLVLERAADPVRQFADAFRIRGEKR